MRSLAVLSWVVVALLTAAGFAAFSTSQSAAPEAAPEAAEPAAVADLPLALPSVSGRAAAFVLAQSIEFNGTLVPAPDPPELGLLMGPDGKTVITEPPTTTTEAVQLAAQAAVTTAAPATTTTTRAPATTTTAPPATTTTTTTAPPPEDETTTTTTTQPPGSGVERWRPLITEYFPKGRIEEALRVMQCESRGDPNAYNARSGASGLFQFLRGTWDWVSPNAGFGGYSRFNAEANIASAAWLVQQSIDTGHPRGPWGHWTCSP